jgi:hypothetical protein
MSQANFLQGGKNNRAAAGRTRINGSSRRGAGGDQQMLKMIGSIVTKLERVEKTVDGVVKQLSRQENLIINSNAAGGGDAESSSSSIGSLSSSKFVSSAGEAAEALRTKSLKK